MNSLPQQCLSMLTAFAVSIFCLAGQPIRAEEHLVPLDELHKELHSASAERARHIADLERVLSYPAAAQALEKYHVSQPQMRAAVATLSDAELARLASRARASEKDVQGGLIVGILALIGLIVVIVIVVTIVADARPLPPSETAFPPPDSGVEYSGSVPQAASVNC